MVNELLYLDGSKSSDRTYDSNTSPDRTIPAMKNLFEERLPYLTADVMGGNTYIWYDTFITLCQEAFSTENTQDMSGEELREFNRYIDYMVATAHTVPTGVTGVGCTNPNDDGDSFVVLEDGTITTTKCDEPTNNAPQPEVSLSLDTIFCNIIKCLPYNDGGIKEGDLVDEAPCPITKGIK